MRKGLGGVRLEKIENALNYLKNGPGIHPRSSWSASGRSL